MPPNDNDKLVSIEGDIAETAGVVNFRDLASSEEHFFKSKEDVEAVAGELVGAFDNVGFAYLENTGLTKSLEKRLLHMLSRFSDLEEQEKLKYARDYETFDGYYLEKKEINSAMLKREYYDILRVDGKLPSGIEDFRETLPDTIHQLHTLIKTIFELLERGLDLEEGSLMDKHRGWMKSKNLSSLRLMKYHALPDSVPEDTLRNAPHVDFGTFAIQFFVDVNGLQLQQRNGVWHKMKLNPSRILLFPGPVLQSLTQGRFIATSHKVAIPDEPNHRRIDRHTIILFTNPDNECIIDELPEDSEDSNILQKKVTGLNFFLKRASKIYNFEYHEDETEVN